MSVNMIAASLRCSPPLTARKIRFSAPSRAYSTSDLLCKRCVASARKSCSFRRGCSLEFARRNNFFGERFEARVAAEIRAFGQAREDFVLHSLSEIGVAFIFTQIIERKNSNRFVRRIQRRR